MTCRLETDIQTLEQHLESMRAAYQLNQEKLDYNYRVLLERDAENQATITQQKRKISKQRDLLSTLMVPHNCPLTALLAPLKFHVKRLQNLISRASGASPL